jgi:hypothetical protein
METTELPKKNLEEIRVELEKARKLHEERYQNAPLDMGWKEFEKYMAVTGDVCENLNRTVRYLETPTFEEIPSRGDQMSLEEFIENVMSGGFIDYDGYGKYTKDGMMSNIVIYPSDITSGLYRKDFETIVWFNR